MSKSELNGLTINRLDATTIIVQAGSWASTAANAADDVFTNSLATNVSLNVIGANGTDVAYADKNGIWYVYAIGRENNTDEFLLSKQQSATPIKAAGLPTGFVEIRLLRQGFVAIGGAILPFQIEGITDTGYLRFVDVVSNAANYDVLAANAIVQPFRPTTRTTISLSKWMPQTARYALVRIEFSYTEAPAGLCDLFYSSSGAGNERIARVRNTSTEHNGVLQVICTSGEAFGLRASNLNGAITAITILGFMEEQPR
jgi:hypothetical protein